MSEIEGLYTVRFRNVRERLAQGPENERRRNARSYGTMFGYGPFTTDVIEWGFRVYPLGRELRLYLHVLNYNGARITRYGYVNLLQNHRSDQGRWYADQNTKLGDELEFRRDNLATEVNLDMYLLNKLDGDTLSRVTRDDTITIKMAIWFILDSNTWNPSWNVCNGNSEDIHFVVDRMTFPAHRAVLVARSTVFRSQIPPISTDRSNNSRLRLTIRGVDRSTLKYLLHFIYTDSLHPDFREDRTTGKIERLSSVAVYFNIEELRVVCEELSRPVSLQRYLVPRAELSRPVSLVHSIAEPSRDTIVMRAYPVERI